MEELQYMYTIMLPTCFTVSVVAFRVKFSFLGLRFFFRPGGRPTGFLNNGLLRVALLGDFVFPANSFVGEIFTGELRIWCRQDRKTAFTILFFFMIQYFIKEVNSRRCFMVFFRCTDQPALKTICI